MQLYNNGDNKVTLTAGKTGADGSRAGLGEFPPGPLWSHGMRNAAVNPRSVSTTRILSPNQLH